jgi:hypothetical protein
VGAHVLPDTAQDWTPFEKEEISFWFSYPTVVEVPLKLKPVAVAFKNVCVCASAFTVKNNTGKTNNENKNFLINLIFSCDRIKHY